MDKSKNQNEPYRFTVDLNEMEKDSFVIIKLGFSFHSFFGFIDFLKYAYRIWKSEKKAQETGLYKTEFFLYPSLDAGIIQYWKSFDDLEKWACKSSDHLAWWKEYRTKKKWKHISVYHESFTIDKSKVQAIYDWSSKESIKKNFPGMASFLPHISPAKYRARQRFLETN